MITCWSSLALACVLFLCGQKSQHPLDSYIGLAPLTEIKRVHCLSLSVSGTAIICNAFTTRAISHQTQRFTASAVSEGFVLKQIFVEAGACRWIAFISFSNNKK